MEREKESETEKTTKPIRYKIKDTIKNGEKRQLLPVWLTVRLLASFTLSMNLIKRRKRLQVKLLLLWNLSQHLSSEALLFLTQPDSWSKTSKESPSLGHGSSWWQPEFSSCPPPSRSSMLAQAQKSAIGSSARPLMEV